MEMYRTHSSKGFDGIQYYLGAEFDLSDLFDQAARLSTLIDQAWLEVVVARLDDPDDDYVTEEYLISTLDALLLASTCLDDMGDPDGGYDLSDDDED